MEGIREFLTAVHNAGLARDYLRAIMHIAIGRKITRTDGTVLSGGVTWRTLAGLLRVLKYDPKWAERFVQDRTVFAIRDRDRFWYAAIAQARVDSPEAIREAEQILPALRNLGFVVGPPPSGLLTAPPPPPPTPRASSKEVQGAKSRKKKG